MSGVNVTSVRQLTSGPDKDKSRFIKKHHKKAIPQDINTESGTSLPVEQKAKPESVKEVISKREIMVRMKIREQKKKQKELNDLVNTALRDSVKKQDDRQAIPKMAPVSMANVKFMRDYRKKRTLRDLESQRTHRRIVSQYTSPVKKGRLRNVTDLYGDEQGALD